MKNWTEFHIAIVYYSGLIISVIVDVLILWYLRPNKTLIKKITERFGEIWNDSFKTSVVMSGLLGAMTVTFKDCDGNYDYLLKSPYNTALKGVGQVSTSFDYLAIVLGIWLAVFVIFQITLNRKNME
ncbi:hypothetical protein [Aestuariivivens sediminis]|uniref:hypothetical protein n=1 Tax=Aestuariivivens sediminis TaxID=2913557 RepID=UPI001F59A3F6|nr:hypothetical protein [Aestuariivivens sediminis]